MTHARCMEYTYFDHSCYAARKEKKDWQAEWTGKMEAAAVRHPRAMWLAAMLGLPVAVVGGVFLATAALTLPLALLMGWI